MGQQISAEARLKISTASLSVAACIFLALAKLAIGLLTRSLGVLAEGLHSGLDLAAASIALVSVRQAARPADERHRFGHGKFETLSGAIEGLLILAIAGVIAYASFHRLRHREFELHLPLLGAAVMVISIVVNAIVSTRLFRVARATDSLALQADAWHLRADVYTSAGVLVGLLVVETGTHLGVPGVVISDPLSALLVAAVITWASWGILSTSYHHLVDRALPPEEVERIERLLREHYPSFVDYHQLRTRRAGPERHIDLHLLVPPDTHVEEAHALSEHLEQDLRALLPRAHVLIHIEPAPPPQRDQRRVS